MTPKEVMEKFMDHEVRIGKIETYFKIIVGFGGVTLPMIVFLVFKIASH